MMTPPQLEIVRDSTVRGESRLSLIWKLSSDSKCPEKSICSSLRMVERLSESNKLLIGSTNSYLSWERKAMDSPNAKQKAIASRIALARAQAGLSQGQVARLMKLHRPSISELEAGRRKVSADELGVMAKLYGVSVSWLACEDTDS